MSSQHGNNPYAPPRYVMLADNNMGLHPPPNHHRHIPRYHSKKKSGCGLCGCLCWCCCFLLIIFIATIAALSYLYFVLDPRLPSYSVDRIAVSAFDVRPDFSLHAEIAITVKAENPNKNIGILYGRDSMVAILYMGATLCSGKLPSFYQSRQNTTFVRVVLAGDSPFGSGLQKALIENENAGSIPLDVYVKVPVVLRAWTADTNQLRVLVKFNLQVDSLRPNKKIAIKSSDYKLNLQF